MTRTTPSQHDVRIRELAEGYRRDGYIVVVEPKKEELPFNLGGYRPDLLAVKGDDGIIVEVKDRAERTSFDHLRSVAEEVRAHDGWRFLLVTAQDIPDDELPLVEEERVSWDDLACEIDRARRFAETGEKTAAYLAFWIAFERLLRFQARRIALPVDRLSPAIVLRQLYSQGELAVEQLDAALLCQRTRNRVVHGFSSPDLEAHLDLLADLVRELLAEWTSTGCAA